MRIWWMVGLLCLVAVVAAPGVAVSSDAPTDPQAQVDAWVQSLVGHLTDSNEVIANSARTALVAVGRPALPALQKVAEGSDAAKAEVARRVIQRIEQGGLMGGAQPRGPGGQGGFGPQGPGGAGGPGMPPPGPQGPGGPYPGAQGGGYPGGPGMPPPPGGYPGGPGQGPMPGGPGGQFPGGPGGSGAGRIGGGGFGGAMGGGGGIEMALMQLGLSRDQQPKVDAAWKVHQEKSRALFWKLAFGDATPQELMGARQTLQQEFVQSLQGTLSADQLERLQQALQRGPQAGGFGGGGGMRGGPGGPGPQGPPPQ